MKILGVDSSNLFKPMMNSLFYSTGLSSVLAESGRDAINLLTGEPFDFICVSLDLEDMNGIQLCQQIRRLPLYAHTPLILFTSEKNQSVMRKALDVGVTDIFFKNDIEELESYLRRYQHRQAKLTGRIIYIEDSLTQQHMLRSFLENIGLEVDCFVDVDSAWPAFIEHDYDLVITDIVLAGEISGLQLVNRIRRLSTRKGDIPILAVSAYDDISRRIDLLNRGVNDYVSKPIVFEELVARVRGLIENKQMMDTLIRQRDEIEKESKDKLTFLANISHEIRTPLNGILGMLHLLDNASITDREKGYLQAAEESGEVLLSLMNDVLDLMKAEAGQFVLNKSLFDLRESLNNIFSLLKPLAEKKHIALYLEISDSVPNNVVTDPARFNQVIINLVNNAIKFTDEGGVTISVSYFGGSHSQGMLHIDVIDTGIGIAQDQIELIFNQFRQESSQSRLRGGSGLGLSIAKRIVESWEGEIGADSTKGHGSRFWFTLPVNQQEINQSLPELESEKATSNKPQISFEPEDKIILVVEDNPVNQKVAKGYLQKLGVNCEIAENGKEAIRKIKDKRYDCVLMDCQMPVMDGFETTQVIREELTELADMPIIAMTAHVLAEDEQRCLNAGMDGFITKPVKLKCLSDTLNQVFNN